MKNPIAKLLAYFGLIPFIALSVYHFLKMPSYFSQEQIEFFYLAYGATILSFLGGIHWGIALSKNIDVRYLLITSNITALLAWISLLVGNTTTSVAILIFGFLMQFFIDLKLTTNTIIEKWFFKLRLQVTTLVLATLIIMLF